MTTQEEVIEEDIRKLNDTIGELQTERRSAMTEELKISLGAQITAMQNSITAKTELLTIIEKQRLFFLEQQSKFTTHFHCPFPFFSI